MPLVDLPTGEDSTVALVEQVRAACAAGTRLRIVGGDTKRFYGRMVSGEVLDVGIHSGVCRYDPAELVITARGGTRLSEIEALLAGHGQRLAFEPPAFGAGATIGGAVAAGLAGPGRVARGPVRDYVLGASLLTGDGRVLRFGGEVMKNVAGFDVSRLLAGSLGILGVLLEVSLKVLPLPADSLTLRRRIDATAALGLLAATTQRGLPVTASFWHDGELSVRLEGSRAGLDAIAADFGGTPVAPDQAAAWWQAVREQRHPFFTANAGPLWRLTLPITTTPLVLGEWPQAAFEWNGGEVWIAGAARPAVAAIAQATGADATLFRRLAASAGQTQRNGDEDEDEDEDEVFTPLAPALLELQRAVKRVFDPAGILNPGRMYAGL
jgi:glycolate oxidase FAD binding subunit